MKDKLTICRRCGSDACYEHKVQGLSVWNCMGCGFTTNEVMTEGSQLMIETEEVMPELYKDIKYIDDKGCIWYPNILNVTSLGTVFVDGTNKDNWRWSAIKAKSTTPEEKEKLKGAEYKSDMSTKKDFDRKDYMEACDYIGIFNS